MPAHLPNSEPIPKAQGQQPTMCRKIITTPMPFPLMYPFFVATIALDLVVEVTPLETFSGDITRLALNLWSLSLNLETIVSAPFSAPTSG